MLLSKPLIHFAHANGVPSEVYQKLFNAMKDDYQIIYTSCIGTDKRYPITNHWHYLVDQVIDSVVQQANGQKVIGLGHSLGGLLTLMASYRRPELFSQVIMLDPPFIVGYRSFLFHLTKIVMPKKVDKITPAGLSKHRRDHWESREQAETLLGAKPFYQRFDPECFQAYLDFALRNDPVRGGVMLTIPKADEVAIFRTSPSWWWLLHPKPSIPVHLISAKESDFILRGFPEKVYQQMGIPFSVLKGGHMFPLEHPIETAKYIKTVIAKQAT